MCGKERAQHDPKGEERYMEDGSLKIVGLAGSLRRASFHRGLIRAAQELAPRGLTVEPYEELDEIPFFNQDVEDQGVPAPAKEFKEKIRQADAVLIATPEYDYAIPGVLTNALDWALRPPSPFRHKPLGIVGTSPGGVGTARGQMVLRQILLHPPAYVMPEPQMLIPYALERFDGQTGDLVDERTRKGMQRFLEALVEWTERFKMTVTAYERSK
jgi:chromate reductase